MNALNDDDPARLPIIKVLLDNGANVNSEMQERTTALMVAVKGGSDEIVRLVLTKNPDIEAKSHTGETALLTAAMIDSVSIVRSLLLYGAGLCKRVSTWENTARHCHQFRGHSSASNRKEEKEAMACSGAIVGR